MPAASRNLDGEVGEAKHLTAAKRIKNGVAAHAPESAKWAAGVVVEDLLGGAFGFQWESEDELS